MSTSDPGGRALARVRLFGFPVHLDLSFVIVMALIGYFPGITALEMGLWLAITPLAVLVHELGHAVLARSAGAAPSIALAGFGGVTTFVPPRPLSRGRSLAISLAGPLVGLVIGFVLVAVREATRADVVVTTWVDIALSIGIWTSIGWSLLNLLPVVPLDGGQAMRELLPGSPEVRARRAAAVSVVTAVIAGLVAWFEFGQPFIAVFMALFVVLNLLDLRRPAAATGGVPGEAADGVRPAAGITPQQAVTELLWRGEPMRARDLLQQLPPDAGVDLVLHGAVLTLTGDRQQGHALMSQEAQRRPGDRDVAAVLALTAALEHDWDGLVAVLQGPLGPLVPATVVQRAADEARAAGRDDVAGRISVGTDHP